MFICLRRRGNFGANGANAILRQSEVAGRHEGRQEIAVGVIVEANRAQRIGNDRDGRLRRSRESLFGQIDIGLDRFRPAGC